MQRSAIRVICIGLFIAAGCGEAVPAVSDEPDNTQSALTGRNDPTLTPIQENRVLEVFRVVKTFGDRMWPGFSRHKLQWVLIGSQYQWAINVHPLPAYYAKMAIPGALKADVESLAYAASYYDEKGRKHEKPTSFVAVAENAFTTDNHYKHPVFFIMEPEADPVHFPSVEDWLSAALFQAGQSLQDDFIIYRGDVAKGASDDFPGVGRGDAKHQELLRPEVQDLAKGACAESAEEAREYLRSSLARRPARWRYTAAHYKADHSAWERWEVVGQGGGKYVEVRMRTFLPELLRTTVLKADPLFHKFRYLSGDVKQKAWCAKIGDAKRLNYTTKLGLGYALILDKIRPGWKTEVFRSERFFDDLFAKEHLLPQ
jgi:hypothetical protein